MNTKDFAIQTAKEAGKVLIDNYGKIQDKEWNLKTNFTTNVDRLTDKLIRDRIIKYFPKHNILSEEERPINKNSEYTWVLDPLDGTIPYTHEITDHFSVCIALVKDKTPILGAIYAPKRDELYFAEQGKGAFCNEKSIKASLEENVNHVIMGLDDGKETETFQRTLKAHYFELLCSQDGIACPLSSGCASVPLCLVASGKLHAYLALSLEPWDMAAAVIINREAGAKVTNINGKEWNLEDRSILSANPTLHKKIYGMIKSP